MKRNKRKLSFKRETIRQLDQHDLQAANGGRATQGYECWSFITTCLTCMTE